MLEKIEEIKKEIQAESNNVVDSKSLEIFRLKYLSRKGLINELFEDFKTIDKSDKGKVGKSLNELKNFAQNIFEDRKARFERKDTIKADADYTLTG